MPESSNLPALQEQATEHQQKLRRHTQRQAAMCVDLALAWERLRLETASLAAERSAHAEHFQRVEERLNEARSCLSEECEQLAKLQNHVVGELQRLNENREGLANEKLEMADERGNLEVLSRSLRQMHDEASRLQINLLEQDAELNAQRTVVTKERSTLASERQRLMAIQDVVQTEREAIEESKHLSVKNQSAPVMGGIGAELATEERRLETNQRFFSRRVDRVFAHITRVPRRLTQNLPTMAEVTAKLPNLVNLKQRLPKLAGLTRVVLVVRHWVRSQPAIVGVCLALVVAIVVGMTWVMEPEAQAEAPDELFNEYVVTSADFEPKPKAELSELSELSEIQPTDGPEREDIVQAKKRRRNKRARKQRRSRRNRRAIR